MKYIIIGSAFAGNKGAASMLEASIQTISERDRKAQFVLFSMYPVEDKRLNLYNNVRIVPTKPLTLGGVVNPLACLYYLLFPFRPIIKKQRHIRELASADALLDQGGITFVDGREKFLIYNLASILPAFFTHTPVIKCSQAMGPFNSKINKLCAKIFLPKVKAIFARGKITEQYLIGLGLKNVELAADYAFLLKVTEKEAKKADQILARPKFKKQKDKRIVAVLPSEVMRKKSQREGKDYVGINADFIKRLLGQDYQVLLIPHSTRFGSTDRHNNDLPVCNDIATRVGSKSNFAYLDMPLSAQQIRHIIGKSDFVVTSRFHAMVSAMAMKTPALIIGWSHKYKEVMDMFGLNDCALGSDQLDVGTLTTFFGEVIGREKNLIRNISHNLPAVKKSSQKQVETILNT